MAKNTSNLEPKVGIFWLFRGKLIIEATTLDKAELCGDCKNHPESHLAHWAELQHRGRVPLEVDHEESPRGRVVYNVITERFTLMADGCILRKTDVMAQIVKRFQLPKNTERATDYHYHSPRCGLRAARGNE
jgi:hypothetical protein